jgi:ATP-dependent Clp protease ATP-binding subunit ClpA
MDYATLTDNNGKKADFRNVILIMTSNAGAKDGQKCHRIWHRAGDTRAKGKDAINGLFSPSFGRLIPSLLTR